MIRFYSSFVGSAFLPRGIAAFTLKQSNNDFFEKYCSKRDKNYINLFCLHNFTG